MLFVITRPKIVLSRFVHVFLPMRYETTAVVLGQGIMEGIKNSDEKTAQRRIFENKLRADEGTCQGENIKI